MFLDYTVSLIGNSVKDFETLGNLFSNSEIVVSRRDRVNYLNVVDTTIGWLVVLLEKHDFQIDEITSKSV